MTVPYERERIAEIGKRANALRGVFCDADEVRWLAGYVRQPGAPLIEVELLLTNAEQIVERDREVPA